MAHVHLEDGALAPEWVLLWSAVAGAMVALALFMLNRTTITTRKLAISAMCTSVGFAVFMVSIPVFGGVHLNLTPLIGILAGPALGSLSVLAINVFSAAVGHGGWGMIGVNTVVNITEVFLGYYAYRLLRSKADRFLSGLVGTVCALGVSAVLVVLIVTVSGIQDSAATQEQTFDNMAFIAVVNLVVAVIEGLVTAYVITFIGRVRPDLLADSERALRPKPAPTPAEA